MPYLNPLRWVLILAIAFNMLSISQDLLRMVTGLSLYELIPEVGIAGFYMLQTLVFLLMNVFLLLLLPKLQLKTES